MILTKPLMVSLSNHGRRRLGEARSSFDKLRMSGIRIAGLLFLLTWSAAAGAEEPLEQIRGHLNRGDYDGASRVAEKILAENPKDVDVMVVYGYGMLWSKDYAKAEKLFLRVLEIAPDYGDAAVGLIKTYTWSERPDKLRAFLAAHGERFKKTAYTRVEVLSAELRLELVDHPEDFTDRAIQLATTLVKDDPKHKQARGVLRGAAAPGISKILREAERSVQQGRLADAERHYAKAVEMDPANDDIGLSYARILSWNQKFPESLKLIARVLERNPRNTDALGIQARVFSWSGQQADAEGVYRKILQIVPDHLEAKQGLADVLRWQGKTEEALVLSSAVIAALPGDEAAAASHARLLGQMGKSKEAIQFLELFLSKYPNASQARAALANAYTTAKRLTDAVNELRKSIQLDQNNKNNYLALGKLYSWQDKTDEAILLYQSVLDRDPENAAALTGMGNTYRYASLNAKALEYYRRALAADPDHQDAQGAVRSIQESAAPRGRVKYSFSRFDDAEPPNQSIRTKSYTVERIIDYQMNLTPDDVVLLKAGHSDLIEKDRRAGDRNYDLDRESISARWNRQWSAKISSVFSAAGHRYKDGLPAFSPLRVKRRRGDFYGIVQIREGSALTTLLYSQDDYIANQTTGILKIGNIVTYDVTHQRDILPGVTLLGEATAEWFSVTRLTRETFQGKLTYKFAAVEGAGLEAGYKHLTSPNSVVHSARLFWARYDSVTKKYVYAHYKYEHESSFHDASHEGNLLYSGPVNRTTDYTAEARYTDYFSGDRSWFGTGYLTFKF